MYRMFALAESGELEAARADARVLLEHMPGLSAARLCKLMSAEAATLRRRIEQAALLAGLPPTSSSD